MLSLVGKTSSVEDTVFTQCVTKVSQAFPTDLSLKKPSRNLDKHLWGDETFALQLQTSATVQEKDINHSTSASLSEKAYPPLTLHGMWKYSRQELCTVSTRQVAGSENETPAGARCIPEIAVWWHWSCCIPQLAHVMLSIVLTAGSAPVLEILRRRCNKVKTNYFPPQQIAAHRGGKTQGRRTFPCEESILSHAWPFLKAESF